MGVETEKTDEEQREKAKLCKEAKKEQANLFNDLYMNSYRGYKPKLKENMADVFKIIQQKRLQTQNEVPEDVSEEFFYFAKEIIQMNEEFLQVKNEHNLSKYVQKSMNIARKKKSHAVGIQ